jgi:hypothetical protein
LLTCLVVQLIVVGIVLVHLTIGGVILIIRSRATTAEVLAF